VDVLVVSQAEVGGLLPIAECMDVMAEALGALSAGRAIMPLRNLLWLPDQSGGLVTMPSLLLDAGAMGLKVISVFPGNRGTVFDSHQGAVLLFDVEHGRLLAIIDATEITAIRTAAVSGVATRLLAREDAEILAILGSGTQARTHLEAMSVARPVRHVRVWSRSLENARRFAHREGRRLGLDIQAMPEAEEAVADADVVCTTTSSREPILRGAWLAPGTHVNAIGAVGPTTRELDTDAIAHSRLFVDRMDSAHNEAGEFVMAREEGAIGDDHIVAELGDVVLGRAPGRTTPEEITVFRGLGLAVEDLAAAQHIYRRAEETGAGTRMQLGGLRHED